MKRTLALLAALLLAPLAALNAPPILLREALQFENTGDSGRVPGTIRLFHQYLPEATVTLNEQQLAALIRYVSELGK